jgi:hypothetical protein
MALSSQVGRYLLDDVSKQLPQEVRVGCADECAIFFLPLRDIVLLDVRASPTPRWIVRRLRQEFLPAV